MDLSTRLDSSWQFLVRDVGFVQGFYSPMLSWLGAGGLVLLFLWHTGVLILAFARIRQAFHRVCPTLARLLHERQTANRDWIVIPSLAKKHAPLAPAHGGRRDLDDLKTLDQTIRAEPLFSAEWLSYRKSFAVEQPSWFIEPTVQTKRSAAEFFSLEGISAVSMNVRFYQQLPSIMTGIGLTFTFLAILIGLSKLHASGTQIEGMQGLINGLAGKFLTSIVGLACANCFIILEKWLSYRLGAYYRQFVSMLDDMFPQHVYDHGAQTSAQAPSPAMHAPAPSRNDSAARLAETFGQRMNATVNALTAVSDSLVALGNGRGTLDQGELSRTIGTTLQKELAPLINPLRQAIVDLSHAIASAPKPAHLTPSDMEGIVETMKDRLEDRSGPSPEAASPGSGIGRLSWMFPQSRKKHQDEAIVE